jgi:hypothetical protein
MTTCRDAPNLCRKMLEIDHKKRLIVLEDGGLLLYYFIDLSL